MSLNKRILDSLWADFKKNKKSNFLTTKTNLRALG